MEASRRALMDEVCTILKLDDVQMFSALVRKILPADCEPTMDHLTDEEYAQYILNAQSICEEMQRCNSFKCYYYLLRHFPIFLNCGKYQIFRLQSGRTDVVFELPIDQIYQWCSVLLSTIDKSIMIREVRRKLNFLNRVANSHRIISLFLDYLEEHDRIVDTDFILNAIYDTTDFDKIEMWLNRLVTYDLSDVGDLDLPYCLDTDLVRFPKLMKVLLPHCTKEDQLYALSVSARYGVYELVKFILDTCDFTDKKQHVMQCFIDAGHAGYVECSHYICASRFCRLEDYDRVIAKHPTGLFWNGRYVM